MLQQLRDKVFAVCIGQAGADPSVDLPQPSWRVSWLAWPALKCILRALLRARSELSATLQCPESLLLHSSTRGQ